jgi:hypothetical protein
MRRPLLGLPGLAAVLVVLASCAGQRAVESGDYTIYVHGSSLLPRGGLDALIEGTLALHDGCVVLESEDKEVWYPVVWPAGTSIASSDPFVISLPSGVELAIGEKVSGGGGYLKPESVEVEIPRECLPETNEIAVFNPDDEPSKG